MEGEYPQDLLGMPRRGSGASRRPPAPRLICRRAQAGRRRAGGPIPGLGAAGSARGTRWQAAGAGCAAHAARRAGARAAASGRRRLRGGPARPAPAQHPPTRPTALPQTAPQAESSASLGPVPSGASPPAAAASSALSPSLATPDAGVAVQQWRALRTEQAELQAKLKRARNDNATLLRELKSYRKVGRAADGAWRGAGGPWQHRRGSRACSRAAWDGGAVRRTRQAPLPLLPLCSRLVPTRAARLPPSPLPQLLDERGKELSEAQQRAYEVNQLQGRLANSERVGRMGAWATGAWGLGSAACCRPHGRGGSVHGADAAGTGCFAGQTHTPAPQRAPGRTWRAR
jgi:hypothetical protein